MTEQSCGLWQPWAGAWLRHLRLQSKPPPPPEAPAFALCSGEVLQHTQIPSKQCWGSFPFWLFSPWHPGSSISASRAPWPRWSLAGVAAAPSMEAKATHLSRLCCTSGIAASSRSQLALWDAARKPPPNPPLFFAASFRFWRPWRHKGRTASGATMTSGQEISVPQLSVCWGCGTALLLLLLLLSGGGFSLRAGLLLCRFIFCCPGITQPEGAAQMGTWGRGEEQGMVGWQSKQGVEPGEVP